MNIPGDLSDLLQAMARDFPAILRENLVGIYLRGSLTYDAFDEGCSDVDCVAVTPRDLDDLEFSYSLYGASKGTDFQGTGLWLGDGNRQDAMQFVEFVSSEVQRIIDG